MKANHIIPFNMRYLRNLGSYLFYYFSLDWFQFACAVIDVLILGWSVFNWRQIAAQGSLALIFIGVLTNFVWQVFNIVSHFKFLKKEKAKEPLTSMLKGADGKNEYQDIQVENELQLNEAPYVVDNDYGVLRNPSIDAILSDASIPIEVSVCNAKHEATRAYIKQYRETLIKFLNHKWYEVTQKGGKFTNDKKVCLATELYSNNGKYKWKISKGGYFDGYLTNFIFAQYVGGTHYKLYPPMCMKNTSIHSFTSSDFSDHIGVSTFLLTKDNYIIVNVQGGNAGYGANLYAPSGSGSLDFADYHVGDDFRKMIICGAEREMGEETSLRKKMEKAGLNLSDYIRTSIVSFYRDMERGGKPEFCCVTRIDLPLGEISGFLHAEANEIAPKGVYPVLMTDEKKLGECLSTASLPFKMCFEALERYLEK